MKILWVSHFLPYPETGFGALQRSRNFLLGLASSHEVTLLALSRENPLIGNKADLALAVDDLRRYCKEVLIVQGTSSTSRVSASLRSLCTQAPVSVELFREPMLQTTLRELIGRENFDCIHADTLGLCERILQETSIPVFLNHHNVESRMMESRAEKSPSPVMKWIWKEEARRLRQFEARYCPQFAGNLTVSDADAADFRLLAPKARFHVLENPVNVDYWHSSAAYAETANVLFVGSLHWYPNRDAITWFLTDIWPLIEKTHPQARFHIVGSMKANDALVARYRSPSVTFHGFVPDVRNHFHSSRVFVCPMRLGGGTNLKIVDAFAAKLPVVSTGFGTRGIMVNDQEHLLLSDTPESFAASVRRVLDHSATGEQLRISAYELVRAKYSTEVLVNKLLTIYSEHNGK